MIRKQRPRMTLKTRLAHAAGIATIAALGLYGATPAVAANPTGTLTAQLGFKIGRAHV